MLRSPLILYFCWIPPPPSQPFCDPSILIAGCLNLSPPNPTRFLFYFHFRNLPCYTPSSSSQKSTSGTFGDHSELSTRFGLSGHLWFLMMEILLVGVVSFFPYSHEDLHIGISSQALSWHTSESCYGYLRRTILATSGNLLRRPAVDILSESALDNPGDL